MNFLNNKNLQPPHLKELNNIQNEQAPQQQESPKHDLDSQNKEENKQEELIQGIQEITKEGQNIQEKLKEKIDSYSSNKNLNNDLDESIQNLSEIKNIASSSVSEQISLIDTKQWLLVYIQNELTQIQQASQNLMNNCQNVAQLTTKMLLLDEQLPHKKRKLNPEEEQEQEQDNISKNLQKSNQENINEIEEEEDEEEEEVESNEDNKESQQKDQKSQQSNSKNYSLPNSNQSLKQQIPSFENLELQQQQQLSQELNNFQNQEQEQESPNQEQLDQQIQDFNEQEEQ